MIRTSAKSLAERTGAAQYAVHIEEELSPDEISSPHDLRKRLSNENIFDESDYEIGQVAGIVGRPGIDFPILIGIPKTSFSCHDVGNGYFADLETQCQVMSTNFKIIANSFKILFDSSLLLCVCFRYSIFARVAKKSHFSVRTARFSNKAN